MYEMPDDFLQDMPLPELVHVVKDLCRTFGVTEEEIERIGRMSPAAQEQMLRDLEDTYRR